MSTYLVLTVIGDDKPGLVELLSEVIARHHGNWLESSMAQLAGKFAGILKVSVDDHFAEALIADLKSLDKNLKLVIEKVQQRAESLAVKTVVLSLVGNDHPGIIREISHVLAPQGLNVEHLVTECVPAPMSGDMLFKARIKLSIPENLDLFSLQSNLEMLADDLIVDIQLTQD
jgi:glycine cleavage system regulatory protein